MAQTSDQPEMPPEDDGQEASSDELFLRDARALRQLIGDDGSEAGYQIGLWIGNYFNGLVNAGLNPNLAFNMCIPIVDNGLRKYLEGNKGEQ